MRELNLALENADGFSGVPHRMGYVPGFKTGAGKQSSCPTVIQLSFFFLRSCPHPPKISRSYLFVYFLYHTAVLGVFKNSIASVISCSA